MTKSQSFPEHMLQVISIGLLSILLNSLFHSGDYFREDWSFEVVRTNIDALGADVNNQESLSDNFQIW